MFGLAASARSDPMSATRPEVRGRLRYRVPIPIYPTVLAVGLVGELFVVSGVSPFAVMRSVFVVVVFSLLVGSIGTLLLRDRDRGGVVAALVVLLLFGGADTRVALAVACGIAIVVLEPTVRRRQLAIRWWMVGRVLTAAAAILTLTVTLRAIESGTSEVVIRALTLEAPFRAAQSSTVRSGSDRPDVYLVLLDGFARQDVIEDAFKADGAGFASALADRGFVVSDRSRSNYGATIQTLASTFAMQRFQDIGSLQPLVDGTSVRPAGTLLREAINDGAALDIVRGLGYELTSVASGYEEPALRQVDRWIDTGQLNEFETVLLRRSFITVVFRAIAPDFVSSQQRDRIDGVLRALEVEAAMASQRPRFIYAHVPSPHAPWVYHGDGTPRTATEFDSFYSDEPLPTPLTLADMEAAYVGQVTWLGSEVMSTVDRVIASSRTPPVIILFSDHGTWLRAYGSDIRLRFRTLLAARAPGRPRLFPDDVTTVDLFPYLLEGVFGINVPKHSDSPSYLTSEGGYDFSPVVP